MRIGIIGVGNIGSGLARVLAGAHELVLYDQKAATITACATECNAHVAKDLAALAAAVELIIIAVKPQDFPALAKTLNSHLNQQHIVMSTAAGLSVVTLRKLFSKPAIVRCMPNIAMTVGAGVMALQDDPELSSGIKQQVESVLAPAGWVVWLSQKGIEAVGALSGSGIAFVLLLMEAMVDAGVAMGFSASQARAVTQHTFLGAAQLANSEEASLEELRLRVTSPGGTTIEGLRAMEAGKARSAVIEGVLAAHTRAQEMDHV